MSLYYADGDRQVGPINKSQLQALIKAKTVTAKTLVWQPGMSDWEELARFVKHRRPSETKPVNQPAKRAACAECGQIVAEDDMIRFNELKVCAACKPTFVQKIKEGVSVAGALDYAGFWVRFAAFVIDWLILFFVVFLLYIIFVIIGIFPSDRPEPIDAAGKLWKFFQVAFVVVYETWLVGKYGATPGKKACKLKVVTADGSRVSYLRALGRHFAKWLYGLFWFVGWLIAGIIAGVITAAINENVKSPAFFAIFVIIGILLGSSGFLFGYIMAAFDGQKRTLHDLIGGTRVVRTES